MIKIGINNDLQNKNFFNFILEISQRNRAQKNVVKKIIVF